MTKVTQMGNKVKQLNALKKAVKLAGGQEALAVSIGSSQSTVSTWIKRGRIGANYALKVHRAFGGQVSAHDLRPDLYPRRLVTING